MPTQFDVYKTDDGSVVLLLSHPLTDGLPVWPVAALRPASSIRTPFSRLEPVLSSGDMRFVLSPYYLASVSPAELEAFLFNASHQRDEIIRAFDVLLTGV